MDQFGNASLRFIDKQIIGQTEIFNWHLEKENAEFKPVKSCLKNQAWYHVLLAWSS